MWEMTSAINLKTNCNLDYPGMKVISIRIVCTACIVCGIASIVTQVSNTDKCYSNLFTSQYPTTVLNNLDGRFGHILGDIWPPLRQLPFGRCWPWYLGWSVVFNGWRFWHCCHLYEEEDIVNILDVAAHISINKHSSYRLVATVVMTAVSIFASLVTALLSAGAASSGVYSSCYRKFGYSHSICIILK